MNKVLKVLGGIAAALTAIIYFGLLLAFSLIISTTSVINKTNLKTYLREIDVTSLPIGSVVSDQKENQLNDNETVKDFLVDTLENVGFSNTEAENVLNSQKIKDIANNYIYDMFDYGLYHGEIPTLDSKEILAAITDVGVVLNTKKTNEVTNLVNELNEKATSVLEIDQIKEQKVPYVDNFTGVLNILNSLWFKISLGVLFILTFFFIALFRWSLYKPFIWLGIPTIIVGFLNLLIGSAKFLLNNITIPELGAYQNVLEKAINPFFNNILINGAIILLAGIIMVIIYTLIDNYKHKKEEPKLD